MRIFHLVLALSCALLGCDPGRDISARPDELQVPTNSCQNRCGQQTPSGCYCDVLCHQFNDCCPDRDQYCGSGPTPQDAGTQDAGSQDAGTPSADAPSQDASTPPSDAPSQDASTPSSDAGVPAPTSCVGRCDRQAPSGCWCDDSCAQFGDCCPDKVQACGN